MPRLVLASASPRRRELLAGLGLNPEVRPAAVDETPLPGEPAAACVERLARAKAEAEAAPGEVVLAADTLVVLDGEILGKPADASEAETMLARLAGRDHLVMTGVAVRDGSAGVTLSGVETTRVTVAPLGADEIARYVASGEPLDKAGAYAIQGLGTLFVEAIAGNYTNVVGLPLPLTKRLFHDAGWELEALGDPPRHGARTAPPRASRLWGWFRSLFRALAAPGRGRFTPEAITFRERGELKELLDESLGFLDPDGVEWVAPRGTLTDGASVPRLVLPVTDGRWDRGFLKAAVVHDAYCQKENAGRCPEQYRKRPWRAVHRMFYQACLAGGTSPLKAKIMFAAVWLGGPRWDDPAGELEQVPADVLTRGLTASKQWIEQRAPSVEEIEAESDRRRLLLLKLHQLENAILASLQSPHPSRAKKLLADQDELLERELEGSPHDLMLLNFRGYWHKNRAILQRLAGDESQARVELASAQRTFDTILAADPDEFSALNGLGSVAIMRGELDLGERYVRRALELEPGYQAAQHDLRLIEQLRQRAE